MAELLDFEWERLVDGYRLERVDIDLRNFFYSLPKEDFRKIHSSLPEEDFRKILSSGPQWVRGLSSGELDDLDLIIDMILFDKPHDRRHTQVDRFLVPNGRETERYRPVDMYPALFMELADSEATPEGAARFINRYGPPTRFGSLGDPSDSFSTTAIVYPVELWSLLEQMKVIKSAVRSWERYRITGKARALIKRVTDELKEDAHLYVRLREKTEDDTISMELVPSSLTAAIWLQFAQAITENYGFGQCDECLAWFEIAPGKGRPEKKFCSNACSMRAYRKRKATKK